MAQAKLDDNFREELKAIEQWFSVLSNCERTTALYSLLQQATPVQIRFFITVLQQMAQKETPGNVDKGKFLQVMINLKKKKKKKKKKTKKKKKK